MINQQLTISNFFGYYAFDPHSSELSPTDQKVALLGTILLGLTCGIGHLICYLFFYDRKVEKIVPDPTKTSTVSQPTPEKTDSVFNQITKKDEKIESLIVPKTNFLNEVPTNDSGDMGPFSCPQNPNHQEKQQTVVKQVTSSPNSHNETKSDHSELSSLFNTSPYGFSFDKFLKNKPMSEEVTKEMTITPSSQFQKKEKPVQERNYEKVDIPPMKKCGMELSNKIIASLKMVVKKIEAGTEDELPFEFNYESTCYTVFQLPGAREYIFKIPASHSDGEWKIIENWYKLIVEIKEVCNELSLDQLSIPNCQLLYIQCWDRAMPILAQEKINPSKETGISTESFDHNNKEKALTQLLELISKIPLKFYNPEELVFLNSQNGAVKIAFQPEGRARTTKYSIEGGDILNRGLLNCLDSKNKEYVLKEAANRNLLQ